MKEQTLIVIKPDGVRRGLVGEILSRFENKGFIFKSLRMLSMTNEIAREFYSPHVGKPFFEELMKFITSGPVVAAILEGNSAITVVRKMVGSTKSFEAEPGTVRGDYGLEVMENLIHAADSLESFLRESRVIFG